MGKLMFRHFISMLEHPHRELWAKQAKLHCSAFLTEKETHTAYLRIELLSVTILCLICTIRSHTYTHIYTRARTHVRMHIHIHKCYTHVRMHTHTHTHTEAHTPQKRPLSQTSQSGPDRWGQLRRSCSNSVPRLRTCKQKKPVYACVGMQI